jgi:hypothetical protein
MKSADAGSRDPMRTQPTRLPTILAATSFALGTLELAAPRTVEKLCGTVGSPRSRRIVRLLGAREYGHGAAIVLGSPQLVWTRVAGDVVDVALLVRGLRRPGADRRRGAAVAGVLALVGAADVVAARQARLGGVIP